jgi:hypothetical protein
MIVDDHSGAVTVCKSRRGGLYADDLGVTVRNSASRAERFAWAEISRFAEGSAYDPQSGGLFWFLVIVLHTGRKVRVGLMQGCAPTPETLTAIRQVADRYAIPADVTGVRLEPGLYHDPGGQPGLRYWDGTHWSPLLPPDVAKPKAVQESPACWPALPMDDRPWTYPAARVKYWTAWFAALAAVSAVLLAAGLVVELWWDRGMHRHASGAGWFIVGGLIALHALHPWRARRFFLKLDAANNSAEPGR